MEGGGESCIYLAGLEGPVSWWSLAIVGKALLKLLAGKEDAALDGAERQTHFVGDFIVFVAGHMHGEWNAVFVGKLIDGISDLLGAV